MVWSFSFGSEIYISIIVCLTSKTHPIHAVSCFRVAAMFVTVCYLVGNIIPVCKKVEFTVTHAGLTQQNLGKVLRTPPAIHCVLCSALES